MISWMRTKCPRSLDDGAKLKLAKYYKVRRIALSLRQIVDDKAELTFELYQNKAYLDTIGHWVRATPKTSSSFSAKTKLISFLTFSGTSSISF